MTEQDLRRVLNESVQDVHLSDQARRNIRLAAKEERPVNMKKFVAIVLAVMLTLSASVGIAAELGMFDFLARKMGQNVLPGAYDLVESDIAHGETDHVSYTIKQAVFDGKSVSMLVEMRAKDKETFLMGESWWQEDPIGGYLYDTEAEVLAEQRTIAQYAADNGYTRLVEASVDFGFTTDVSGVDEWNDNVLTVLYSFAAEGDELIWPIEYFAFDHTTREAQRAQDTITLKANTTPLWQVSSSEQFEAPDFGIRIDGLTITGTVVQSYWTLTYTVTDVDKARSFGWNTNLVDMDKQYLPDGVLGVFSWASPEESGQVIVVPGTIAATEQPPTELMILLRNWDDHSLNNYFPVTLK